MYELYDRKIKRGKEDRFKYKFEYKRISTMGVVHRHSIDITNWEFKLFVHEKPMYRPKQILFGLQGQVMNGESGIVVFNIPRCFTDMDAGTYWYSIYFKKPNGHEGWLDGAKYIIAETLNPYFSIYPEHVENDNYKKPIFPDDYTPYRDVVDLEDYDDVVNLSNATDGISGPMQEETSIIGPETKSVQGDD